MATERRVVGPPGCAKTTWIQRQVATWTDRGEYWPQDCVLTSFTRAAAAVLKGRVDVPWENTATLHSLAYRALGSPPIAETGDLVQQWNADVPKLWQIGKPDTDLEDGFAPDPGGEDDLFAQYNLARLTMAPEYHPLRTRTKAFAERWEAYKRETSSIDFADMILLAAEQVERCPGEPPVIIADEAQDFVPAQWTLIRRWAEHAEQFIVVGDPAQVLYSWVGATPDAMLAPLPEGDERVLSRSFRVPQAVQEKAEQWLRHHSGSIADRRSYQPTENVGVVRRLPASWRNPSALVHDIEDQIARGRECMVIATCQYMLQGTCGMLRALGIPYHNPYRLSAGAWNPLGVERKGSIRTLERVLSFLRPDPDTWGESAQEYTPEDVRRWAAMLKAEAFAYRGAKKRLEGSMSDLVDGGNRVTPKALDSAFDADALWAVASFDTGWLASHSLKQYERITKFADVIYRKRGGSALREKPKVIVGTVHSVKGGEADCSPPDEPVLTTNRGYVPISDLDPSTDKLVSFDSDHHKIYRGGPRRPHGYSFTKGRRSYTGPLLVIETDSSRTRVTPNHIVTIRWTPKAEAYWAVYLMRRGNWWRLGAARMRQGRASGLTIRMGKERGDALWVLGCYETAKEAHFQEALLSHQFHVPDLTFEATPKNGNQLGSNDLHQFWDSIDSESGALALLNHFGMSPEWPIWGPANGKSRRRQTGVRNRWQTRACNLIPGFMEIPTDPGSGQEPAWKTFSVKREHFEGLVYSLDVERWHHYVSGGAVVHNCVYVFPDLSLAAARERNGSQAGHDAAVRVGYVAMTRARNELILCEPVDWRLSLW